MSTEAPTPLNEAERNTHDRLLDVAWSTMMRVCPPVDCPPKPTNATRILEIMALSRALGWELLPHQVCIVATITEVADDEHPGGPKKYLETALSMARQSGKSASLIAVSADRLLQRVRTRMTWCAQVLESAVTQVTQDFWPRLEDHGFEGSADVRLIRGGHPELRCGVTGGWIHLRSTNATKGARGAYNDCLIIDEAFSLLDFVAQASLFPTLSTRARYGAHAIIASSAPLEYSVYWSAKLVEHRRRANKDGSSLAFWHWGADVKDDHSDPAVWRRVIPGLAFGLITEDFVRSQYEDQSQPPETFLQEWMNIETLSVETPAFVSSNAWQMIEQPKTSGMRVSAPLWLGIDAAPDQSIASAVVADNTGVFELAERRAGITWILPWLAERWELGLFEGVAVLAPGPLSGELNAIEAVVASRPKRNPVTGDMFTPLVRLNGAGFAAASQQFLASVLDSAVAAVHSAGIFADAVGQSRRRYSATSGGFTIARRDFDSEASALVAAAIALYAARSEDWAEYAAANAAESAVEDELAVVEAYYGLDDEFDD